jgi:hypothetical protein
MADVIGKTSLFIIGLISDAILYPYLGQHLVFLLGEILKQVQDDTLQEISDMVG